MISTTIIWVALVSIFILLGYTVVSKQVHWLPKIPFGLVISYFVLIFFIEIFKGYTWSIGWAPNLGLVADVLLAWGVARIVFWLLMAVLAKFKDKGDTPAKITHDFLLFITFVILVLLVLRYRSDINLASLLTTSALITVVIGLAAQATLSNFFSGLIIQAERPFVIGDWLQFGDTEGRVVGISWKSTQLLTREEVLVYIPNSLVASSTFSNYSRPTHKKIARIYIGLEYGVPYNKVKQVITEVVNQHPSTLKRPPVNIRLIEYSDFAINYEIRVWHTNFADEPQMKADINQQLWYALRRNNIRIPFPIRDVFHGHIERKHNEEQLALVQTETAEMMRKIPILSPLSDEKLADLAQNVHNDIYGAGEFVVQEGAEGDSMFIIRSGVCDAMRMGKNGKLKHLSSMQQGDFFGEISLLTGEKRTATIKATEDTSLIVIEKSVFAKFMSVDPVIPEQIAQVVLERQHRKGVAMDDSEVMATSSKKLIQKIKLFFGI